MPTPPPPPRAGIAPPAATITVQSSIPSASRASVVFPVPKPPALSADNARWNRSRLQRGSPARDGARLFRSRQSRRRHRNDDAPDRTTDPQCTTSWLAHHVKSERLQPLPDRLHVRPVVAVHRQPPIILNSIAINSPHRKRPTAAVSITSAQLRSKWSRFIGPSLSRSPRADIPPPARPAPPRTRSTTT